MRKRQGNEQGRLWFYTCLGSLEIAVGTDSLITRLARPVAVDIGSKPAEVSAPNAFAHLRSDRRISDQTPAILHLSSSFGRKQRLSLSHVASQNERSKSALPNPHSTPDRAEQAIHNNIRHRCFGKHQSLLQQHFFPDFVDSG